MRAFVHLCMRASMNGCMRVCVHALNRLPLKRNIYEKTGDGIRPIEQLTNGKINRDDLALGYYASNAT